MKPVHLLIVGFLCIPELVSAQTPLQLLQRAQEQNWVVRSSGREGVLSEGLVRRVKPDSVVIGGKGIDFAAIELLERRIRINGGGSGGALIGALGFGMFTFFLANEFCKPDCKLRDRAVGIGIGVGVGASLGGVIGGIIHPSETAWTRVWP